MTPTPALEIRELRLDDDTEVAQFLDVVHRSALEVDPHATRMRVADFQAMRAVPHPQYPCTSWVALDRGRVVAGADAWGAVDGSPDADKMSLGIDVDPELRGRGIGSAMLAVLEREVAPGRPELLGLAEFRGELDDAAAIRFARRRGWEVTSVSAVRQLDLPVDPELLDRLEPETGSYRVQAFVDGIPENLRESWGRLVGLVEVDAPTGDVEWHGTPLTPSGYALELQQAVARGEHLVQAVAILGDGTDAEVVALHGMRVRPEPGSSVGVESTCVHRDHRGHRLGMAVKVAALRSLAELGSAHPRVSTSNDEQNVHMVAINEQLGFTLQRRMATLRTWRAPAS